jgi:hypothetical protein
MWQQVTVGDNTQKNKRNGIKTVIIIKLEDKKKIGSNHSQTR